MPDTQAIKAAISVVVPTFNDGNLIRRCIASIAAQTLQPHEIIVVDDGSTDRGAIAELEVVVRCFPAVTLLRQPNSGPSAARNAGLARCTGTLVAFVDADDELTPDSLSVRQELFDSHPDLVGAFTGVRFAEEGGRHWCSSYRSGVAQLDIDRIGDRDGVPGFLWAYLLRVEAVRAARGLNPDLRIMEDFDLLARIGRNGGRFAGTETIGYIQHRRPGSLARGSARRQMVGALRFLAEARRQGYFTRTSLIRRYLRVPWAALKVLILYGRAGRIER